MTSNKDFIFTDPYSFYFVTFSAIKWINIFNLEKPKLIFLESLRFLQKNQNLGVYAYVIMPSHVHMIVANKNFDNEKLHKSLTALRKFTGAKIIKFIETEATQYLKPLSGHRLGDRKHIFWQEGWHSEAIYNDKFYFQKMDYIHNNPVKAQLVDSPEDWPYSSAGTILSNKPGFVEIDYF